MDFHVKEIPLGFCPHCGLPVRSLGRSNAPRYCSASCRAANVIFGGGKTHNTEVHVLRVAAGFGGLVGILVCRALIFLQYVDPEAVDGLQLAQSVLFLPVFLAFGLPQCTGFGEESSGLRHGSAVAVAALATWGFSSYRLTKELALTYFDLAALVVVLTAVAALMESAARMDGVRLLGNLLSAPPDSATVLRGGAAATVRVAEVRAGDRLRVAPGEALPADGRLVEGKALLSTLRTNGSAEPLMGQPGQELISGYVNLGEAFVLEATKDGEAGWWRQMHKGVMGLLLEREAIEAGPAGLFAAGAFISFSLAAVTFGLTFRDGFDEAFMRAFAVLVLASPGPFAATADRGLSLTLAALQRMGVEVKSLRGLWDLAEAPVSLGGMPIPTKGTAFKFNAPKGAEDIVWAGAVKTCREFKYNIDTSSWFLLLWTLVGLVLAATGLFSPPMAASFSLFGAMAVVHRTSRLGRVS